jgi:IQ calmodulin-binding motif
MKVERDHFDQEYAISQEHAATLIQGHWRMNREHNRFEFLKTACTLLQSLWRRRQQEIMVRRQQEIMVRRQQEIMVRRRCLFLSLSPRLQSTTLYTGCVFDSTMLAKTYQSDAYTSHSARCYFSSSTTARNRHAALHKSATFFGGADNKNIHAPATGTCRAKD